MDASQISINIDKTTLSIGESIDISGVVESAIWLLADINYTSVIINITNKSTGESYNHTVSSGPWSLFYNYIYPFTPLTVGNYEVFAVFPGNADYDASQSVIASFVVTSAPSQPADVHLWRVAGAGSVEAFKNNVSIGSMAASESSKTFTFNIDDTFKFVAHPASGWAFDKYCADSACATKSNSSTFTGKIVSATTNMYVYFSQGGTGCVPVTRHCETPLNGYDTDGCTRGANAACNPAQPPPGTGKRYSCINGVCTEDSNGVYTTPACGGACIPAPQTEPPYAEIAIVVAGLIAAALILKKKE